MGRGVVHVVRDGLTKMAFEQKPERQLWGYLGKAHCQLLHVAWGKKSVRELKMYYPEVRQSERFFFFFFKANKSEVVLSAFLYKLCKAEFQMQSTVI